MLLTGKGATLGTSQVSSDVIAHATLWRFAIPGFAHTMLRVWFSDLSGRSLALPVVLISCPLSEVGMLGGPTYPRRSFPTRLQLRFHSVWYTRFLRTSSSLGSVRSIRLSVCAATVAEAFSRSCWLAFDTWISSAHRFVSVPLE